MSAEPSVVEPPSLEFTKLAPSRVEDADVVAIPVLLDPAGPVLGPGAAELLEDLGDIDLFGLLEHHRAVGKVGEVIEHPVLGGGRLRSVLLVGVGDAAPRDLRRAGAALARRVKGRETVATSLSALADDAGLTALVEGVVLGSFGFHRKSTAPAAPVTRVVLAAVPAPAERRAALERAVAIARAAWDARTLALVPSNEKNPAWMVQRAKAVAAGAGLKATVWDHKQLKAQGFGGMIGVGQGSDNPPYLVQLDYRPGRGSARGEHIVLVGKGITFDTGGYSIKPSDGMATMKRDMTGAGVVLSVMGALAAVKCPVRVTGLLMLAENSISGRAQRPGDVIRHYGGRTSEVTNTDAEGRLVLADGMAYAVDRLKPTTLVDVATLTGAMKVALGMRTGGFFATDDDLATTLLAASETSGEALWRMPLFEEYAERIDSKVADADNAGGSPGAITAALFLKAFAGDVPWAHLDIASVGDSPVDAYEWTSGATGFGARVLLHWLTRR